LETEKGSTTSHPVEKSLRKSLWTCRKTDYGRNEWTQYHKKVGRKLRIRLNSNGRGMSRALAAGQVAAL